MKKYFLPVILIVLCTDCIYSQERVSVNVVYGFTYVRDLADRNDPYKADMVLSLGKNTSRYCTEKLYEDKTKKNSERKASAENTATRPTIVVAGGPLLLVNKYGAIINEEVIKDISNEKMSICASMGFKSYEIDDKLPKIDWKIEQDKKLIGKYNCQRATGSFGGRIYTAWFTTDLPFRDGPWKLSGLPGLILEAQDQKKELCFSFKEISRNISEQEKTNSFFLNDGCIKVSMKSYIKAKEAFEKDPEAIMAAMAPNAKLMVRNIDDPDGRSAKKITTYNPMEL